VTEFVGDLQFTCHVPFLASAFLEKIYHYFFLVPSSYHGDDVLCTFYNDGDHDVDEIVTHNLQDIIIHFDTTGAPTSPQDVRFSQYWPGKCTFLFNFNNEVHTDTWKNKSVTGGRRDSLLRILVSLTI